MEGTEDGDRPNAPSEIVRCFWCEQIHEADHPLSVCARCRTKFTTMRSLGMSGSYPLDDDAIDEALTRKSPGNFALGYLDGEAFVVFYVGRSDSDLRQCLHGWVGRPSDHERYASPARAPWEVRRRGRTPGNAPSLGRVSTGETSYTRFAYSYAASAEAAFEKECRNYDDFGGSSTLDNAARPTA